MGVNPGPFTLRELTEMSEGVQRDEWSRHSQLLALIANCNRDPESDPVEPNELNPFIRKKQSAPKPKFKISMEQYGKMIGAK